VLNPGDVLHVEFSILQSGCAANSCNTVAFIPMADTSNNADAGSWSIYSGVDLLGQQAGAFAGVFHSSTASFDANSTTIDMAALVNAGSAVAEFTLAGGQLGWYGEPRVFALLGHAAGAGNVNLSANGGITVTSVQVIAAPQSFAPLAASLLAPAVTPTPEPASLGMALAGLALIGWGSRRRK
jgi:MYXO-CTERM domain-containing protein